MPAKPTIVLIGAGNLAAALAPALVAARFPVCIAPARPNAASRRKAAALARQCGAEVCANASEADAGVIWLCITDDAIRNVAERLAAELGSSLATRFTFHSSGALSSAELGALKQQGAHVASVHPMMTFIKGARPSLAGVTFALEGDAAAVRMAKMLVSALGGEPFRITSQAKPLYHAVGSFSSPMVVATLATAERIAEQAGLSKTLSRRIIAGILQKTVTNFLARGSSAAFSGPINRGDLNTVARHLSALADVDGAREIYSALARSAATHLPVRRRAELLKLLDDAESTPPRKKKARRVSAS